MKLITSQVLDLPTNVAGLENSLDRRGERDDPRVELPKSENHAKILLTRSIIHNSIRIKKIYMKEVEKVT